MQETYLAHHGVKGQKWGVRRYQNDDGSLTEKGIKRYSGKHGAAKYVFDTNPAYIKKRKVAYVGDRVLGAAFTGAAAKIGYGTSGSLKERTLGALKLASVAAGLSVVGSRISEAQWNAERVRDIERNPSMQPQLEDARRYLRSQGINV